MSQFILSVEKDSDIQAVAEEGGSKTAYTQFRSTGTGKGVNHSFILQFAGSQISKERLVSCKAVERVISDFSIKPPEWFVSPYPNGPFEKVE